jgi:hypothetical protein
VRRRSGSAPLSVGSRSLRARSINLSILPVRSDLESCNPNVVDAKSEVSVVLPGLDMRAIKVSS